MGGLAGTGAKSIERGARDRGTIPAAGRVSSLKAAPEIHPWYYRLASSVIMIPRDSHGARDRDRMNRKERRGQAKEAQEAIKKAANEAAKADEADGHRSRAKQFAEEGKIYEATEAFRQAISIDPEDRKSVV